MACAGLTLSARAHASTSAEEIKLRLPGAEAEVEAEVDLEGAEAESEEAEAAEEVDAPPSGECAVTWMPRCRQNSISSSLRHPGCASTCRFPGR